MPSDSFKLHLIMIQTHILGFPRIGAQRELKFALERHWRCEASAEELEATGRTLRRRHWEQQRDAGLGFLTVGDFAYYDQVADTGTRVTRPDETPPTASGDDP